jgi:hypothetical protein
MSLPIDPTRRNSVTSLPKQDAPTADATPKTALDKARDRFNQYDHHATKDLFSYTKSGANIPKIDMSNAKTIAKGDFNWSNSVYSANHSWGTPGSNFNANVGADFLQANAKGQGSVSFDPSHLTFGAQGSLSASAYLVNAHGDLNANYGWGSTQASGYATVGAEANAKGSIAFDPLHGTAAADVGVDAFAGARAGVDVKQTVGPATITAGAKVEAGIGVDLDAHVGFDHGKFSANFDIGACLGIGADLKFGFSIDTGKLAHEALDLGKDVVHGLASAATGVEHAAESVAHGVEHAAESVAHGVEHAASSAWHALTSW